MKMGNFEYKVPLKNKKVSICYEKHLFLINNLVETPPVSGGSEILVNLYGCDSQHALTSGLFHEVLNNL